MFSLSVLTYPLLLLTSVYAAPTEKVGSSSQNLVQRQSSVQFNSTWPDQFVGGESVSMSWTGSSSGKYSVAWIEEYNGGDDLLLNFVFQDEAYDHYDFYFAPARCWKPDSTFRFIVWDGEGFPLPEQRAYGPKLPLVEGENEPSTC
ncbi:uncharacterized protein I303_107053 [Kwoniella dejecticola CBS 10117]|uniref:Uncharacterized protein n=1 Tax=Kwoniella dejecticola CBS 10117 TaxID=1296121 RepID=A0A1A5ZYL0_9TREE|nr:uncharacterized protein I303_06454 [Kwoniella dejecticola CBS 10117]OBR82897.1 hypothetical protein I303_06454 [Kwoniella dejecticola CBS 10117]